MIITNPEQNHMLDMKGFKNYFQFYFRTDENVYWLSTNPYCSLNELKRKYCKFF